MTGRQRYASLRSILEVPILNDRYWAKVPDVEADAIMVDLEDSATPSNKDRARAAVVEWLPRREYFGDRTVVVRVNNLDTPWAVDDLTALAGVDAPFIVCYPKVQSRQELERVATLLAPGPSRPLYAMIETARAVVSIDEIASHPDLVGLHYGYVDLSADVGSRPFAGNALYEPAHAYPRARIAMAAAAHGLFASGGSLIPDYQNLDMVRAHVEMWRDVGFTSCIAVTPRHVALINDVMTPSKGDIDQATRICLAYQQASSRGEPVVQVEGRTYTLPDYRVAALVLTRAGVAGVLTDDGSTDASSR